MRSSVKTRGVTGRKPGVTGQAYSRTEKELNGSLKRAEKQQLDEFLRARTEAVDKDIRELRSRLAVDGSRDLAEQPAYGELLHPRGPATLGRTDLMISGTGSPRKDRQVSRPGMPAGAVPEDDRQMDLLQRINDAVHDSGLGGDQLNDLLHPGTPRADPTVSLRHLIEILQLDLVLPVSREDQAVLTRHYGVSERHGATSVDAVRLFRDAGIDLPVSVPERRRGQPDIPVDQYPYRAGSKTAPVGPLSTSPYALRPGAAYGVGDDDSDLDTEQERRLRLSTVIPADVGWPLSQPDAVPRHVGRGETSLRKRDQPPPDVLSQMASKNLDMLKGMHDLVAATEDKHSKVAQAQPAVEEPDVKLLDSIIAKYRHLEPAAQLVGSEKQTPLSISPSQDEKPLPTSLSDQRAQPPMVQTPARIGKTEEMSEWPRGLSHSLDKDKLDHYDRADDELGDIDPPRRSTERLAQNAKAGLHAMERAGLLGSAEPFPRRPPHSAARTSRAFYPSGIVDTDVDWGGNDPSNAAGTKYSLRVPRSDAARSYRATETTGPSDGSFSDLCERRLVFEITNHKQPVDTFRSLLHAVMDTARKNGYGQRSCAQAAPLNAADPSHVPPAPKEVLYGFVTAAQLYHISRHVGLSLSLGEIELIAAGFASDGCGGFNATEFCEALQDLMYATDSVFLLDGRNDDGRNHSERQSTGRWATDERRQTQRGDARGRGIGFGGKTASRNIDERREAVSGAATALDELNDYWMIVEFEFVDDLLSQLEALAPSDRRRRLLSLRHLLWAAEANSTLLRPSKAPSRHSYMSDEYLMEDTDKPMGSVEREVLDGFTLLKCLVNSGFDISRYKRSHFLSAVEELGGRIRYTELCNILMSGCSDWPAAEHGLTSKILKAMGPTVPQRRVWLARFRDDVNAVAKDQREHHSTTAGSRRLHSGRSDASSRGFRDEVDVHNPGIPASSFLHVLRELGTSLSVDEEATLLDCLDLERQSELVASAAIATGGASDRIRSAWTRETDSSSGGVPDSLQVNLKIPLVYYKSFLAFCNRHSGDWTMFLPDLYNKLKHNITSRIDGAFNDVLELKSLFLSFDESSCGVISKRSFLVACHRSSIFSRLSEEEVTQLTEVLSADSGGSIDYRLFLYYLQSLALIGRGVGSAHEMSGAGVSPGGFRILSQLLEGGSSGDGTLTPLRSWLSRALRESNSDGQGMPLQLTRDTIAQLLRDFGVVYEEEDLLQFLQELSLTTSALNLDEVTNQFISKRAFSASGYAAETVDVRSLFYNLFKVRGEWGDRQPALCDKIRRCFAAAPKGAARRLLTRLNSFSTSTDVPLQKFTALSRSSPTEIVVAAAAPLAVMDSGDARSRVVRREVFLHVVQACGMPLDEDDIYLLADATDLTPFAEFVSPHEALLSPLKEKAQGAAPGTGFRAALTVRQEQGEQGKAFAVRHFRSQLAKAALQQKRTPLQWQADVYSVFTGFDRGGGFVTGTDFKAALNILGVNMSYDLLASLVPRGSVAFGSVDMIHFEQVLSDVFDESSLSESVAGSSGRMLADLETSGTDQRRIRPALGGPSHLSTAHKQRPVEQTDLPKRASNAVKALVSVVRRGMEKFIVNGSDIEDVCVDLVSVFKKFDSNKDGLISARDFCLGVSILLGGDDVVFGRDEWEEVIDYFAVSPPDSELPERLSDTADLVGNRSKAYRGPVMVNYVEFIETVLDSSQLKEIKARLSLSDTGSKDDGKRFHDRASASTTARNRAQPGRGATLSVVNPDLTSSDSQKRKSIVNQPTKLRKTAKDRYQTRNSDGDLYSPVVGGTDGRSSGRWALSPKGHNSYGNSRAFTENGDRDNNNMGGTSKEGVKLTQKQHAKAKQLQFGNQELRALEDLKVNVSEALGRRPIPKGKSKSDVLRDWLEMEDSNRNGSLSKNSVIATLNAIGLPYESWSTPSQRNLVDFLAARGGGVISIDDVMALIGAKL